MPIVYLIQKKHWQENQGLSQNLVRAVQEDVLGRIWIGTGKALQILEKDKFTTVPLFKKMEYETINDLHLDKKNQLLIGTSHGIFIVKYQNEKYQKPTFYEQKNNDINTLHDNIVLDIFEDNHHEGLYWLGTYLSGIGQMYERKKRFVTNYLNDTKLKEKIGASVHLITKKDDILWLNTTSGLLRYDKKNDNYQLLRKFNIVNKGKNDFEKDAFYHSTQKYHLASSK